MIIVHIISFSAFGNEVFGQLHSNNETSCLSNLNSFEGQPVYHNVDISPEFIGGQDNLLEFISKNIQLSKASEGISKVLVSFIVDSNGKVRIPCILQQKGSPLLANEDYNSIISIFNSLPNWQPALHKAKKVYALYTMPIYICIEE